MDKSLQPVPCVVMISFWKEAIKLMQIIENICTKSLMHGWFCKETHQELIKKCVVRWPCCMCMLISFIPFWKYTWLAWNILWFCFYIPHFWFFDPYFQLTKPNKSFFQKKTSMWGVTCHSMYMYLPLCVPQFNGFKIWTLVKSVSCGWWSSWNPRKIPNKLDVC